VPLETELLRGLQPGQRQLVDLKETPIERITEPASAPARSDYEFDIIIYATGFDAVTGAFDRIDFADPAASA
jgi:cation diffusion facilitator CzcD-associated flavoprotein CzcO